MRALSTAFAATVLALVFVFSAPAAATSADKPSGNQGWDAGFGSGPNGTVQAIAVSGNNVYAGGNFETAGGISARRVARWDGSQWHPMGSGANTVVFTLVADGSTVYAGGGFTSIGGVSVNRLARWDGSQWHPMGAGVNSYVQSIVIKGKTVYAGGNFVSSGGSPVRHVAKWDGSQWRPLGAGVTDPSGSPVVYALALVGGDLFMAGGFFYVAGQLMNGIARWDGSQWHPLGTGLSSIAAQTLTVSGSNLYVGGGFDHAGGVAVNKIARWGCDVRIVACMKPSWSALDTGMNDNVFALSAREGRVFAGGNFTTAGGTASERFGLWHETP